jgi:hypothetical protein
MDEERLKKFIEIDKKNEEKRDANVKMRYIQLCHDHCNTPFVQTFPRKSPENPGKVR